MSTMLSSLQTVFKIIELSFAWSIKLVNSKKKKKKVFYVTHVSGTEDPF